tara:strand:+ start:218 stop:541 length:324 start_codon:yes stop_codon:yes gene_type:complete
MILKSINSFNSILGVGSRKIRKPHSSAIEEWQAKYLIGNRDRHLTEGTRGEGCASKDVCTKSKRKLEAIMYCYRGIKYDPKTLKSKASKSKKSKEVTYRGITGKIAA